MVKLKALFILFFLINGFNHTNAQQEQLKYISLVNGIKEVTNAANVSYKYKISLQNTSSGKEAEQITGIYSKVGKAFLDSNRISVSLLFNGYFFKTENSKRIAYLYRISEVERKMGIKEEDFTGASFAIPDSVALKSGKFSSKEINGNLEICYVLDKQDAPFSTFYFVIRKRDKQLQEIRMISPVANGTQKVCRLFGFTNSFDIKRVNSSNYYSINGNKPQLIGNYRSFKVQAIL